MVISTEDLLLKRNIALYNNIAKCGGCVGRLTARLDVYPVPKIWWEFESIGEEACEPPEASEGVLERLVGERIAIERPVVTNRSWGTVTGQARVNYEGIASSCTLGESDLRGHSVRFYLPNCRFLERTVAGQGRFEEVIRVESGGDHPVERSSKSAGRVVLAPIDSTWLVSLETTQDALAWLNPNQNNVGSFLTTSGHILHRGSDEGSSPQVNDLPDVSIEDAMGRLQMISLLLSFANGGYVGPLYLEVNRTREAEIVSSEMVSAYRTTPLEQVGPTWVVHDSDMVNYLATLENLEQLLTSDPWSAVFDLILVWYFQAIQPVSAQIRGKPWPVVASAIGAALERLGVAVVVDEFGERGLSPHDRLVRLLEIVGISPNRGHEDPQFAERFIAVRNDATHPTQAAGFSTQERETAINRGIQWLEEVMLWRLGYEGRYRDRTAHRYNSIEHRYDLSSRPSD